MRENRPKSRLLALGSAGVLVTATLVAGAVSAPTAGAASRPGPDREAKGAGIAANRAA